MESKTDNAVFARLQLPRPDVTQKDAEDILSTHYGLAGILKELGSQQDRNYRVDTGKARFVLKICRVEYTIEELEAQNLAMGHLHTKSGAPRVPTVILALNGDEIILLEVRGQKYRTRLLEYLNGRKLDEWTDIPAASISALGDLTARLTVSLADFDHPGLNRSLQWDLRRAGPVANHLLSAITNHEERNRLSAKMTATLRRIHPLEEGLRIQPVHHDLTGDNVLSRTDESGHPVPEAVIDFGDVMYGWLVGDLAVTCSWLLQCAGEDIFSFLPAVVAYHNINPLNDDELRALWPLIVARAVVLVASSEQQLSIDPSNDYVRRNLNYERRILEVANSVDPDLMETKLLSVVGTTRGHRQR
ncbi:APH-domain-containing protein [Thozetella sp. PMI_491]|nr:APH-domain-containing protein [Thozetella sp. PMI_491]